MSIEGRRAIRTISIIATTYAFQVCRLNRSQSLKSKNLYFCIYPPVRWSTATASISLFKCIKSQLKLSSPLSS